VLDCGCGGGVTAIAAAANGALLVTACDLDHAAVDVAKRNATVNRVEIAIKCQDVIECCNSGSYDLILVADLFYEKEFSKRLLVVLQEASKQGTVIVIADSGRPFLSKENLKEMYTQSAETSFDVEGCVSRTVRLYSLQV
jgi:predicted nicotinamide N-methyase